MKNTTFLTSMFRGRCISAVEHSDNKKVLLLDRRRSTARGVANQTLVLSWGVEEDTPTPVLYWFISHIMDLDQGGTPKIWTCTRGTLSPEPPGPWPEGYPSCPLALPSPKHCGKCCNALWNGTPVDRQPWKHCLPAFFGMRAVKNQCSPLGKCPVKLYPRFDFCDDYMFTQILNTFFSYLCRQPESIPRRISGVWNSIIENWICCRAQKYKSHSSWICQNSSPWYLVCDLATNFSHRTDLSFARLITVTFWRLLSEQQLIHFY